MKLALQFSLAIASVMLINVGTGYADPPLPSRFDLRELGKVGPVRNQGSLGVCWAFGKDVAVNSGIALAGGPLLATAPQQSVSCPFDPTQQKVALEQDYPYTALNSPCNPQHRARGPKAIAMHEDAQAFRHPERAKRMIMQHGALAATIIHGPTFKTYYGGVLSHCDPDPIFPYHAVAIIGWDDAGGYWIGQNSWDTWWGERGYFRISYDSVGRPGACLLAAARNYEYGREDLPVARVNPSSRQVVVSRLKASTNYQEVAHYPTPLTAPADGDAYKILFGRYSKHDTGPRPYDLFYIAKSGTSSGRTEVHVAGYTSDYQSFWQRKATLLPETDGTWDFAVGDYNNDGMADLYAIKKSQTGSGRTEIHILRGAGSLAFEEWLLQVATPLQLAGDNWEFLVDTVEGSRTPDLIAVKKSQTGSSRTEVHVLSGSSNYQQFILQAATTYPETGDGVEFRTTDFNIDGGPDLLLLGKRNTGSGMVEVHLEDISTAPTRRLLDVSTPLGEY